MRFIIPLLIITSCTVNKSTQSIARFKGEAIGCGSETIYKLGKNNAEYLAISFDASDVELATSQAYAVDKADIVDINYKKFEGSVAGQLCNTASSTSPKMQLEQGALSGIIEIKIQPAELEKARKKEVYNVTVVLKNIVFDDMIVDYLILENVNVGWFPG